MKFGKLFCPTTPGVHGPAVDRKSAVEIARRVLSENGMADFSVSGDKVSEWNRFYLFPYHNTAQPGLANGGGASLVVRKKDGLGGMVHVPPDWMETDLDKALSHIATAFAKFDEVQISKS
jgi:hypothetical protein